MSDLSVRKYVTCLHECSGDDAGNVLPVVTRKAWVAAVVRLQGATQQPLNALIEMGAFLGQDLGQRVKALLNVSEDAALAYGKAAMVGSACSIEQAAALLHPKLGKPLRAVLGQGPALIPSTVKHAVPGVSLDVPLQGAKDEWDFAMLDTVTVSVDDAPLINEVVVVVAVAYGARAGAVIGR